MMMIMNDELRADLRHCAVDDTFLSVNSRRNCVFVPVVRRKIFGTDFGQQFLSLLLLLKYT